MRQKSVPSVFQTERPFSNLASGPEIGVHFTTMPSENNSRDSQQLRQIGHRRACSRTASSAIFAFNAASIFRLVFVIMC